MLRTRYTDEDKARLLREFDACGGSAAAFCRERGVAYQTFHRLATRRKRCTGGHYPSGQR